MIMVNAPQGQQPMQPGQMVHQQTPMGAQMIVTGPSGQQQMAQPQQVYNPYGGQVMMMNPQTAPGQVQPGQPVQMVIMPQQQQVQGNSF